MINKAATARAMAEMRRSGANDAEKRVEALGAQLRARESVALRRLLEIDVGLAQFLKEQARQLDEIARLL